MTKHLCHFLVVITSTFILLLPQAGFASADSQKEWTLLVFINGHNDLDRYGKMNINHMEKVGSSDQVNIVVQWASLKEGTVRRLKIEKDQTDKVASPVLQDLGQIDMGDYRQLSSFITWGVENFPAKKYFIAVWNHGNGWNLMNAQGGIMRPQDISYDDITGNQITTEELAVVMEEAAKTIGHKVDVYGSDACLMAMVEIAAQMDNSVRYFIGSQENEPGEGWPYQNFLERLDANPRATGAELSTYLVEEYHKAYTGGVFGRKEVTLSALDLSKIGNLYQAMADFSRELKTQDSQGLESLREANRKALKFDDRPDFKDLSDLVEMIKQSHGVKVQVATLAAVQTAVQELVVINKTTKQYSKAQGVSIWSPHSHYDYTPSSKRYDKLHFHSVTGWGDVIRAIND